MPDNTPLPSASPPSRLSTALEIRAAGEWLGLLPRLHRLRNAPRGDGRPVMLLPGYRASERSMRPLRRFLDALGYDTYDWGIGRNVGDVRGNTDHVGERVKELTAALDDSPVTLIGWSLGGVVAREVARLYEPEVREVITLGTPIIGGPKYTFVGRRYASRYGLDLDRFEREVHARNSAGVRQPVTSIYSKTDGIVGWRASVDVYNCQARNIEVRGSHLGLGVNPAVWRHIADTLANSA
jgi:pimeloyl-ACP methyl ester carboxylesterase